MSPLILFGRVECRGRSPESSQRSLADGSGGETTRPSAVLNPVANRSEPSEGRFYERTEQGRWPPPQRSGRVGAFGHRTGVPSRAWLNRSTDWSNHYLPPIITNTDSSSRFVGREGVPSSPERHHDGMRIGCAVKLLQVSCKAFTALNFGSPPLRSTLLESTCVEVGRFFRAVLVWFRRMEG